MTQLQESVIEKAKKALNISEDTSSFNLYDQLYILRNNSHPDKYLTEGLKKEAEEKFKQLSSLLADLRLFIDREKLNKLPSELISYKEQYELINDKSRIIELEEKQQKLKEETESLKGWAEMKDGEIKKLQDYNKELHKKNINVDQDELIKMYKPTKSSQIIGFTTLLLLILNIVSNLTSLKEKLSPIFPFNPQYINIFLFGILILVVINLLLNNNKRSLVKEFSDELMSQIVITEFHDMYKREGLRYHSKYSYFTEKDVTDFIKYRYGRNKYLKSLAYYLYKTRLIEDHGNIDTLKKIFISNLFSKKLITGGEVNELNREFTIINSSR
ncbi:MAG TPA: hypothetical protein VNY36_02840 [Bacteroidia bacterium]|jgi:hypothetical protein|nr:hypothetical protein [Bacteroidia bacterium]